MIPAKGVSALAICALLCACGCSKKDSFNRNFHQNFVRSCWKSATASGVNQQVADVLCSCASNKVNQRFSVKEKMSLKAEQLKPIMAECNLEISS